MKLTDSPSRKPGLLDRGDETELLEKLRSSSAASRAAALEELLTRSQRLVASVCLRMTGNPEDAADASQEALIKISRTLPGFQARCRLSTWVYSVTRSVCLDLLRQRGRREEQQRDLPEVLSGHEDDSPSRALEERDRGRRVLAAIRSCITEEESRILLLHHVDGLSMKEITEILELPNRSGARAFLARAKRKLRRQVAREEIQRAASE